MPADSRPLIANAAEAYGSLFQPHLLEQYKVYVEQASKISERRTTANSYLLTVNTLLVTLYGLATAVLPEHQPWHYFVPGAGLIICGVWWNIIRSYRDLNTVKFRVIHELEHYLPAALYAHEWALAGEGEGEAYLPLTHIEPAIPWTFFGLYVLLAYLSLR
jgi:hypothetical protein